MDNMLTRYLLYGVGLFVIIIILTIFMNAFSGLSDVYRETNKTNISIKDKMDTIYYQYDDNRFIGLDLVNILKRYEDEESVLIETPYDGAYDTYSLGAPDPMSKGEYINDIMQGMGTGVITGITLPNCLYETIFYCDVTEDNPAYEYVITFTII